MFIYTLGDILGVFFLALMLVALAVAAAARHIERFFCKHERYFETMACDAVCRKCGKNLGFIGRVQEERRAARAALEKKND